MLLKTIVCFEDGVMQVFECLIAPDFNHAADLLIGELLSGEIMNATGLASESPMKALKTDSLEFAFTNRRVLWYYACFLN